MLNTGWTQFHYQTLFNTPPPPAYPYLTFFSRDSTLTNYFYTSAQQRSVQVELLMCVSTYMGYSTQIIRRDPSATVLTYGIIRVPDYDNLCVVATTPGGTPTAFKMAPCSFDDDESQIAQFFVFDVDMNSPNGDPYARYLGDKYATTLSNFGMFYSIDPSTRNINNEALLNVLPAPSGGPAPVEPSIYFIPH